MTAKKKTTKSKGKMDVLAHYLVPKHTILTKQQTAELLEKFSIGKVNLPRMFEDDPAAVALGARQGDVVKIVRVSQTIVDHIDTYRFVVVRRA